MTTGLIQQLWQSRYQLHTVTVAFTTRLLNCITYCKRCLCHWAALCIQILISDQSSGLRCVISNITFITARVYLSHENRKDDSGVRKESWPSWTQLTAAGRQTARPFVSLLLLMNYLQVCKIVNELTSVYPVACKEMWDNFRVCFSGAHVPTCSMTVTQFVWGSCFGLNGRYTIPLCTWGVQKGLKRWKNS